MITDSTPTHADQETIRAVKSGELDRFRELIERYEGQVYAVAWSRLGDASLAEEVVQEAFIKAYRYLGWLRDPSRFGGWLTRITRGLAINLGIRHRRELNRRQRWALDPSVSTSDVEAGAESTPVPQDTLREALAALSANHRECLILHYLEGRSIHDAAEALGISDGAFKVRLHRARAALRHSIESRLGESLGRLSPRTSQASAIMAALPGVGFAGTGSGLLAGAGAALAKLVPLGWLALLLPVISASFGVGAAAWMANAERKNYRQPSDFRAKLHQQSTVRALIITALLMLVVFSNGMSWLEPIKPIHILIVVGMCFWLASLRYLQINRRPEILGQVLSALPMWVVIVAGQFVSLPTWSLPLAQVVFFGGMAFSFRSRPLRFDYNLFVRAAKGMLASNSTDSQGAAAPIPLDQIKAFGRLLGSNWLIMAYRRESKSFTFGLTPVKFSPWQMIWPFLRRNGSWLTIATDGGVSARLGPSDHLAIEQVLGLPKSGSETWEIEVVSAVRAALSRFCGNEPTMTLKSLGETAASEIFVTPPESSGAFRFQRAMLVAGALSALLMVVYEIREKPSAAFRQIERDLVPIRMTLEDAHRSLAALGASRDPASVRLWRELHLGLDSSELLPPGTWFQPAGLSRLRTNILSSTFRGNRGVSDAVDRAVQASRVHKAMRFGWLTTNDLAAFGVHRDSIIATVASWAPAYRAERLGLQETTGHGGTNLTVLDVDSLRWRIEFLITFDCLDLLPRDSTIETLRARQIKAGNALPVHRPDLDSKTWDGFFLTAGGSPIHETASALKVLAMLGAMDKVDREACTRAILRLHRGAGAFGGKNRPFEFQFTSPALTTYEARESLRLLGTSDQVADFPQWEFRIARTSDSTSDPSSIRPTTWMEIEAVLAREADRRFAPPSAIQTSRP